MISLSKDPNGSLRWQSSADCQQVLFGSGSLRLDQWRKSGCLSVVKHRQHRTVYCLALNGRTFYVKQYRPGGLLQAIGQLVRSSPARREYHKARRVGRRGILTIRPVAWAEQLRYGIVRHSYLVTEAIADSVTLERYLLERLCRLPPGVRHKVRRALIGRLARFVAAIHEAGIIHNDFHLGNVLVRLEAVEPDMVAAAASCRLYLIDVPGVRFCRALGWSASRKGLVMLNAAWRERISRSDRLRFWRTYLASRPQLAVPQQRRAIAELERQSRQYSWRLARRRDRRAVGTNRHFTALRHAGKRVHAVAELSAAQLAQLLQDPEEPLRRGRKRLIKRGRTKLVVETELGLEGGPARVVYKRYQLRNWWKALLGLCGRSRALRGWCAGHALLERQIPAARPLAVCQLRRLWSRQRGYLAVEWIERAENLHLYAWHLAGQQPHERLRQAARCAQSLGRLVGRMHAWGITHGDLKASNLLVREGKPAVEAYLIDVEDIRIRRRLSLAQRAADLGRLGASISAHRWITRTITCRFIRAYMKQQPPGSVAWKRLWRKAARRAERIVAAKRRRGQQIL